MARSHDLPGSAVRERHATARAQVARSMLLGGVVAAVVLGLGSPSLCLLAGWDTATLAYMGMVWLTIWPRDAERTARLAVRADPTRATADLLLLSASVVSLIAVAGVLVNAAHRSGGDEVFRIALGLASVVLSWGTVHTVFTLRYARLYYTGVDGGVRFNQAEPPRYSDFAYLAFTVGMTFQVSDTNLENEEFRRTVLWQGLLSYLFGTGILATAINLVASLSSN